MIRSKELFFELREKLIIKEQKQKKQIEKLNMINYGI